MMMITRKELAGFTVGFGLLLAAVGCGSDPVTPALTVGDTSIVGTSGKGNEVDRSDATATANAFASMYAAGNTPGACQLANDDGRENIGSKCDRQQAWNTTVALAGDCESTPVDGAKAHSFHFEAPGGTINRNSDLDLVLVDQSGAWSVAVAVTPSAEKAGLIGCLSTTSATATG